MADQIEDLIVEIAPKHGIAVSRNDPIPILLCHWNAKAQKRLINSP